MRERQAWSSVRLGKPHREGRSDSLHAHDVDLPVEGLDEVLHDGEAEPRPPELARARLVDAVEPLEDAREVFLGYAHSRVLDVDPRARLPRRSGGLAPQVEVDGPSGLV